MKPNGLVAAASITPHTSSPRTSHACASSLASAMLIIRKVFSYTFTSSAASALSTGTIVSKTLP
jgi:hypothetical protein